jgi:hypothetical protein
VLENVGRRYVAEHGVTTTPVASQKEKAARLPTKDTLNQGVATSRIAEP